MIISDKLAKEIGTLEMDEKDGNVIILWVGDTSVRIYPDGASLFSKGFGTEQNTYNTHAVGIYQSMKKLFEMEKI